MNYLQIHGADGLIVHHTGSLNTDKYGLDSATATWKIRMDAHWQAPGLGSRHPVWGHLTMERRRIDVDPGFATIIGEYVGITGGRTTSVFEASYAESEEEIETHPKFVTDLAGTASAPKNFALFVDVQTGRPTTDKARAVFLEFRSVTDSGGLNELSGVESFLSPHVTVRETWMSTSPVNVGQIGHINAPPIGITIPGGGNWLYTGAAFTQRGQCYQNSREWRSSGRRAWSTQIYG